MANRWCDGFGRYGGNLSYALNGSSGQAWAQIDSGSGGQWALSNANPRTGNWHLRMTDGIAAPQARRVFGAALGEVLFGQAVFFEKLPSVEIAAGSANAGYWLASFRDAANNIQCGISVGTDGALCAWSGKFGISWDDGGFVGTLLGRSIPIIGAGAYQHVEIYAKAGNGTAGAIEVRVDEVTRLNLTGVDTITSANVEFSQVAFGRSSGVLFGGAGGFIDVADAFCNDTVADGSGCNTFIGDCKSGWLPVDADTAQADFALSAGVSGYSLLAETPPDDSTYIDTAATTAESDFGLADGPANLSEILTVRPAVRAMKDDAGTCTIAPSLKSSATKAAVPSQPLTTAFAYYDSNVPVDPATGVPWMPSGLSGAEHVVERTA